MLNGRRKVRRGPWCDFWWLAPKWSRFQSAVGRLLWLTRQLHCIALHCIALHCGLDWTDLKCILLARCSIHHPPRHLSNLSTWSKMVKHSSLTCYLHRILHTTQRYKHITHGWYLSFLLHRQACWFNFCSTQKCVNRDKCVSVMCIETASSLSQCSLSYLKVHGNRFWSHSHMQHAELRLCCDRLWSPSVTNLQFLPQNIRELQEQARLA